MALKKKRVSGRITERAPVKLYLSEWMARLGRKAVEIARAADVTESYISELASGKKPNPSLPILFAIADELGITVNDLRRPPPSAEAIKAAKTLEPGQIVALGKLLEQLKK